MSKSERKLNVESDSGPMATAVNEIGGLVRWKQDAHASIRPRNAEVVYFLHQYGGTSLDLEHMYIERITKATAEIARPTVVKEK